MPYLPLQSRFGTLWIHACEPIPDGPEWARRERLLVDSGPRDSYITVRGVKFVLHGHLFAGPDGRFRFSDKDKYTLPADIREELEPLINRTVRADERRIYQD